MNYVVKKEIILKDCLKHPKYNWPQTLLTFSLSFEYGEVLPQCWELQDDKGNSIEYQVSNVVLDRGFVVGLDLHILGSLNAKEEQQFYFLAGTTKPETEQQGTLAEDHFALTVEESTLKIIHMGKQISYALPFPVVECKQLSDGLLFSETQVICYGENKEKYTVKIKRTKNMPFVEICEQMEGFSNTPCMQNAEISFDDMLFAHRYSSYRPVEKVDAYLIEGRLPVTMMPFENWISWFQSKHIVFLGESVSAGFFIKDNLDWNDGTYPIWGSDRTFGISFYYQKNRIQARLPLINGTRSFCISIFEGNNAEYLKYLWFWYTLVNLNKVKDWVLEWDEDQDKYPMFFDSKVAKPSKVDFYHLKQGESVDSSSMRKIIDKESSSVNSLVHTGPVAMREFASWAVITDITAAEMSNEEFAHTQAAWAFMAYVAMDENFMPTRNMLAGHPNFLSDVAAIAGFMPSLFPNHPQKEVFYNYFRDALHTNLKYHIRPDVAKYGSLGGRETESLSTYTHAMLRPYIHVCQLYDISGIENPLVCNQAAKLLDWLTNCLTAPVDGVRLYPPQGAHARSLDIPRANYQLAQMLENDYPKQAHNFFAACEGNPLYDFELAGEPFSTLFKRQTGIYKLSLKSEKYTGYGLVLRESVGTSDEISVHIQQLDEGPNYRWGTFENTGNGSVYYCAGGKRYSHSDIEDVGDRNIGAEEGVCGFAVLKGHTYHNIGFNDLTEPLFDFPTIKSVKLLAGDSIKKYYKSRTVSLVGADYIILYDAVTHMRARSRFVWSVAEGEDFPNIIQLKPGASPAEYRVKGDISELQETVDPYSWRTDKTGVSKTIGYDGFGDFLTVVSHRKDISATVTENGAIVILPERTDYIFEDSALCHVSEAEYSFEGYSGFISVMENENIAGAIFDGSFLSYKELSFSINGKCALYFEQREVPSGGLKGQIIAPEDGAIVTINGVVCSVSKGRWEWFFGDNIVLNRVPERLYEANEEFVRDTRRHEWGFNGTDFWEERRILQYPLD